MKNHKKAWTMVELTIAVIVLIILSTIAMNAIKPNKNKTKLFVYSTIRNIERANSSIMEKNDTLLLGVLDDGSGSGSTAQKTDKYCLALADTFNLPSSANCKAEVRVIDNNNPALNMTFPNNVQIMGMYADWVLLIDDVYVKHILIDIDGSKGKNKIGIDRFPMTIYASDTNSLINGRVLIDNCDDKGIYVYDSDGNQVALDAGYCNSTSKHNFQKDNEIVSYDIYRVVSDDENAPATLIYSNLSTIEADCGANGGNGYFNHKQCNDAGAMLLAKCAHVGTCNNCQKTTNPTWNICPNKKADGKTTLTQSASACETEASTTNPNNENCIRMLHKPNAGLGFLVGSIMGKVDMDSF